MVHRDLLWDLPRDFFLKTESILEAQPKGLTEFWEKNPKGDPTINACEPFLFRLWHGNFIIKQCFGKYFRNFHSPFYLSNVTEGKQWGHICDVTGMWLNFSDVIQGLCHRKCDFSLLQSVVMCSSQGSILGAWHHRGTGLLC